MAREDVGDERDGEPTETEEAPRATRSGRIDLPARQIRHGTLNYRFEADAKAQTNQQTELVIEHSLDGGRTWEWYLKVPNTQARDTHAAILIFDDDWWNEHPIYWVRGYLLIDGVPMETRVVSKSNDQRLPL